MSFTIIIQYIMNIQTYQPQEQQQQPKNIEPSKSEIETMHSNFRKAYQSAKSKSVSDDTNSKELQCPDCGIEYFKNANNIPKQLSCGHVSCGQCITERKHGQEQQKEEMRIKERMYLQQSWSNCSSAKIIRAPYLSAHINKLIQERNDSLSRIVCSKHPKNEAQYYEMIQNDFVCCFCVTELCKKQEFKIFEIQELLKSNKELIVSDANQCLTKFEDQIQKHTLTFQALSSHYHSQVESIQVKEGLLIDYIKQCASEKINELLEQMSEQKEIIKSELETLRIAKVKALMPTIRLRNANEQDLVTEVRQKDIQEIEICKKEYEHIIQESKVLQLSEENVKIRINQDDINDLVLFQ